MKIDCEGCVYTILGAFSEVVRRFENYIIEIRGEAEIIKRRMKKHGYGFELLASFSEFVNIYYFYKSPSVT